MKYNIENLEILKNKEDRLFLEEQLELLLDKISFIPLKYRNSDIIEVNLQNGGNDIKAKLSLNLCTGVVSFSKSAVSIQSLESGFFDKFAEIVNIEVEKIRSRHSLNKKNSFIETISMKESELLNLNEVKRTELFKSLITATLPDMIGYIKRRVYSARLANIKAFNNVFVKDIVSEVILQVHGRFQADIINIKDFNIWNIQEADKVLNEILENNDHLRSEISYEQLVDHELSELEEEYTTDADGDFVMNEEIDEFDLQSRYSEDILSHYISDKEQIEEIDIADEDLNDKIYDELIKLPIKYQSIYDLYYFEHLEIEEIARIKDLEPIEIEAILISIKELISEKL
ncbi:MAG: RNA polymerase sigma factor [Deltaproteobacteria bacterium]